MATKYIQDPNNPYASIPAESPYFTQKPATTQTPTAPTPTTPTTPTAPTGSTQSYLDNLLSVATERGLDVQQILTNPNYVPPKTIVEKDFSGSNTVTNLVQTQLDALQKEKADAQAKLEAAGKGGATDIAGLIASYKTPTMDLAGAESRAETKYGTADALAKMQQQNAIVAGIQGELNQLNTEEMTAIDRAEGRVASRGAIEGEKETITRDYNIKKAYKYAELYAQAALAQVYSNNYENAQNLVAKAVDYYITEIQQQIADYKYIFSMQSDWIKSLKDDEKDLLKMKYDELVDKEDKLYNEKMNVAELMLKYPSAGISISDSLDKAIEKSGKYTESNPEIAQTLGSAESGYTMYDKYGNIIGTKAGSETSGTIKLTNTQIMNGAAMARKTIDEFKNLSSDEQAWYITGRYNDALSSLASTALQYGLSNASYTINNDSSIPASVKTNLIKDLSSTADAELSAQTKVIKSFPEKISLYDESTGKEIDIVDTVKDIDTVARNLGYGSGFLWTGNNVDALYDAIDSYIEAQRENKILDSEIFKNIRSYLVDAQLSKVSADNPLIKS